jgi:hypothetical protein
MTGIQSLKAFLDSIAYSEESSERNNRLTVLQTFFEAQKPRDHAEQHDVYLPDLFRPGAMLRSQ